MTTDVTDRVATVEEYLASTGNLFTNELTDVGNRANQTQTSLSEEQAALKQEVEVEIPADFASITTPEEGNWKNLANQLLQMVRAQDVAMIQALTTRVAALEQGHVSSGSNMSISCRQRNVSHNANLSFLTPLASPPPVTPGVAPTISQTGPSATPVDDAFRDQINPILHDLLIMCIMPRTDMDLTNMACS
eukprot:scaffold6565_cov93-Cylindrotheca_fusiformis.AAC.4